VTDITARGAHADIKHLDQIVEEKESRIAQIVNSQARVVQGLIAELESIGQPVSCKPGERVLSEGETGKGIYILRSGAARVSMASNNCKTRQLRELEPGSFIGLSSTLSCDHCCYTVEATDNAEFTFVPAETAQELLRLRPDLCLQVIQLLGKEMSSLCHERALLNTEIKPVQIET
jgi:CRP-like cAMP-binding protein